MMGPATHRLSRPEWQCSCGEAWPCAIRRTQLLDAYSGQLHELRQLMALFLSEALGDVAGHDVEGVRRQLVGWLPPRAGRGWPAGLDAAGPPATTPVT